MFIIRVSCILAMVETRASSAPAIFSWLLANLSRLSANLAWLKAIRSWLSSTACVTTLPQALGARVAALVDSWAGGAALVDGGVGGAALVGGGVGGAALVDGCESGSKSVCGGWDHTMQWHMFVCSFCLDMCNVMVCSLDTLSVHPECECCPVI